MVIFVRFEKNLDRNHKLYIPKFLRDKGFGGQVVVLPLGRVALLYPSETSQKAIREDLFNLLDQGSGFTEEELWWLLENYHDFFRDSVLECELDKAGDEPRE